MPYNRGLVNEIRISIIIPCFNEERYLARCLDSIAQQTVPPYEVLVIDNNSQDGTTAIARRYPFVRLLAEAEQGRVFARNTGFQAATGTVLARIDADAVLPNDWTKRLTRYYSIPAAAETAWTGGAYFYNVRFPRLVSTVYDMLVFGFNRVLAGHPTLWGSNMALPVALWNVVAHEVHLRNDIHEDLDLAIHVHRHGYRIVYERHVKVHVQLRRVRSNRQELWRYLQMWPRTLRTHGIWTWPICWLFGDVLLYALTPFFSVSERIARLFGRRPLSEYID
jgi:glycosyltransferase involved in cell wall biosynthesis